jgi:hypothetical protein
MRLARVVRIASIAGLLISVCWVVGATAVPSLPDRLPRGASFIAAAWGVAFLFLAASLRFGGPRFLPIRVHCFLWGLWSLTLASARLADGLPSGVPAAIGGGVFALALAEVVVSKRTSETDGGSSTRN